MHPKEPSFRCAPTDERLHGNGSATVASQKPPLGRENAVAFIDIMQTENMSGVFLEWRWGACGICIIPFLLAFRKQEISAAGLFRLHSLHRHLAPVPSIPVLYSISILMQIGGRVGVNQMACRLGHAGRIFNLAFIYCLVNCLVSLLILFCCAPGLQAKTKGIILAKALDQLH